MNIALNDAPAQDSGAEMPDDKTLPPLTQTRNGRALDCSGCSTWG
jgi:hypothetical protein